MGTTSFDLGCTIEGILGRAVLRVRILIKQCSAFFPGPWVDRTRTATPWMERIRDSGIRPVLATVVPLIRRWRVRGIGKDMVSPVLRGGAGGICPLWRCSDRARAFSRLRCIPVLDLEAGLRKGAHVHYRQQEFGIGDRVQVSGAGSRFMDEALAVLPVECPYRASGASARFATGS
ncbi:MAG: hypothetical protein ACYDDA_06205 [Acidiferrobacteraceae bacterium]